MATALDEAHQVTFRRLLLYAVPIAAIIAIGALIASAPLYRGYSMQQCLDAYADARTSGDTARLDLHPYRHERDNRTKHRCGEVRAVAATDSLPIISSRAP